MTRPIAPPTCETCLAEGLTTRPEARILRNSKTKQILCEDHLPRPAALPLVVARGRDDAIVADRLTKRYGNRNAVDALSFVVPKGGIVGFLGPNGAGKTTTIRMLLGLVRPTDGNATVLGESIDFPERFLHRVGALIESPACYPYLTGRKNLRALAVLGGHDTRRVDELLARVGLAERGDSVFKSYSLGMKQRLGIAVALLPDPDLLILDEPTNGLDPAGIHEVRAFLRELGNQGKTIFVSSHLLSEIQRMCDRLVVLRNGRLVFEGTVQELQTKPRGIIVSAKEPQMHTQLIELCRRSGFTARITDGTVVVDAPASWSAELNQRALQAGIVLRELRPHSFDLEETILDMTGREAKP